MKPTPKPRRMFAKTGYLSPERNYIELWCPGAVVGCKGWDNPVLVINLLPKSVEALKKKAIKAALDEYANPQSTIQSVARIVLSTIGIKAARVAKRKGVK